MLTDERIRAAAARAKPCTMRNAGRDGRARAGVGLAIDGNEYTDDEASIPRS